MIQDTVNKLYRFIAKLVLMLEEELDEISILEMKDKKRNSKKQLTDTLKKLVSLIVQLDKLKFDDNIRSHKDLKQEDRNIIDEFLKKHSQKS